MVDSFIKELKAGPQYTEAIPAWEAQLLILATNLVTPTSI